MEIYQSSKTAAEMEYALSAIPSIGANNHWFIGDQDTGVLAEGLTPYVGAGNHWFIGDVDTGISAEGLSPHVGENGNWWIGETDTGVYAGGVKVEGAQVGQTIVVKAVDENGKPTEWEPAAFGPRPFKKLYDTTLTEETGNVRQITISQDMDGNPIDCTMIYCRMYIVPSVGTDPVNIGIIDQTGANIIYVTNGVIRADKKWHLQATGGINHPAIYQYTSSAAALLHTSTMSMNLGWNKPSKPDKITRITVEMGWTSTGTAFGSGSRIEIWGA